MYWLQTSALDHYSHGETNYSQVKFRLNGSLWHLLNCRIYNQSPALVMTFNKVRVQLPSDSSICHFCKTDHFPTTGRLYFHSHEHAIRLQSLTSMGLEFQHVTVTLGSSAVQTTERRWTSVRPLTLAKVCFKLLFFLLSTSNICPQRTRWKINHRQKQEDLSAQRQWFSCAV